VAIWAISSGSQEFPGREEAAAAVAGVFWAVMETVVVASNRDDGRFYYSGIAQAVLLDRLTPGWKDQIMADGVFLEMLLKIGG
jgi:hypothetical protein